jgi:glycosyltransferase involved in cell wall biosynthesis
VVHPVDNGTAGQVRFGGLDCFRHLVSNTADILTHCVLPDATPVLILALDAPFLCYQVPDHALIELPNGLSPTDWRLTPPNSGLPPHPARDGFLLAMGRAQPYKGFDDLVDALALLRQQHLAVPHLVLAAVTDNPELSSYQQHLAMKIANEGLDITLLTRFHPDIRRLLAHPTLRGVVVPSRAEPFGRVPIEAYAAGASPVIATTVSGLAEQVSDRHTGFTAAPQDPANLAATLRRAIALTPAGHHRMRDNARRFAAARYNYPLAVRKFLTQVAPWHDDQQGRPSLTSRDPRSTRASTARTVDHRPSQHVANGIR